MKLNAITKSVLTAISVLTLAGCGSDDSDDSTSRNLGPATLEIGAFNGSTIADNNNIPIPNDLYIYQAKDTSRVTDPEFWELETYTDGHYFQGCAANTNETKCSLSDVDGWSTTAPFVIPVSGDISDIDLKTLVTGVKLFKESSQDSDKATIGALEEVTYRETFEDVVFGEQAYTVRVASFGGIQILPLTPLDPETTYVVAVTSDLKTTDGETILTNGGYAELKSEPTAVENTEAYIYDRVFADHTANVENALNLGNILYSASFTTQSVGKTFSEKMLVDVTPAIISSVPNVSGRYQVGTTSSISDPADCSSPSSCVFKASESLELPYFLNEAVVENGHGSVKATDSCFAIASEAIDAGQWFNVHGADSHVESYQYPRSSCDILFDTWSYDRMGKLNSTADIVGFNLIYPESYVEGDVLPVAIFIHGITAAKELGNGGMLMLDNFIQEHIANKGYAVLAIDHHLHGSRGIDFNRDVMGVPALDIVTGANFEISASSSVRGLYNGHDLSDVKYFLKADALLTSRDNFRQAVADVVNLRRAIPSTIRTSFDADGIGGDPAVETVVSLDTRNVSLVGHSMGAIIAATATGILNSDAEGANDISRTVLANPGAGIAGLVFNSTWLGKDEVPPAIKLTDDFQDRVLEKVEELTGESPRDLLSWAKANKATYDSIVAEIEPAFMSEFQYLIQSVVDTVDPLNYVDVLKQSNVLSITVDGTIEEGVKPSENYEIVTTGDQTVPVKIELDQHTMFERCNGLDTEEFGAQARCALGTEDQPYYELNLTEFPLAGAYPLETLIGMTNVKDDAEGGLIYSRLSVGTHNIGVGTLTETTAAEGNANSALVGKAAALVADQAAKFVAGENAYNVVNQEIIK